MTTKNKINFRFNYEGRYSGELVPFNRKTIYGERKILAFDKDNNCCDRILYDEADMTLFPKKSTGICRFTKDGRICNSKAAETEQYSNGQNYASWIWEDEAFFNLEELSPDEIFKIFPYAANCVYTLQGESALSVANEIGEKIYHRNYRDFVFQRNGIVFWVKCKTDCFGDYAEKEDRYSLDGEQIESDITNVDEIDFELF